MMPEDWNHIRDGSMLNLKNVQKIWDISLVPCHMKGHEARIFHRKTRHQAFPVFMLLAGKKATGKTYLLHYNIWLKTLYTTLQVLLHWNVSTYYYIVTQSRLQKKPRVFMKLFFVSRTRQIDVETLTVSESTFKNKGNITLNTFRNVAYVSSYLRTKIFARKRDCAISSKLQIPRR